MWLLHVSVLVCIDWPGSKRPPWKQALWRWAALEGFPSRRSSRTPKILESCQSTSKLKFTSTSTTTLCRWSSRWNCSPVPQAEQTDSRNESTSKFWWENVFYEQDNDNTTVQSNLLCSSSSEKWGQHDTKDDDYLIMTAILYKWDDDDIIV